MHWIWNISNGSLRASRNCRFNLFCKDQAATFRKARAWTSADICKQIKGSAALAACNLLLSDAWTDVGLQVMTSYSVVQYKCCVVSVWSSSHSFVSFTETLYTGFVLECFLHSVSSPVSQTNVSQTLWDRGPVNSVFHKTRARSQQIY